MKGLLFNIKRYAIHDGPGIRVTFFLKGCPLDCWWCHNPEGISPAPVETERIDRIGDREFHSREWVGKEYSPEELLAIAEKERVFMDQSGGGVTFSGGEPTLQYDFLLETLKLMKNAGISTAVDTSGLVSGRRIMDIAEYTDIFLYDIKLFDTDLHKKFTGADNSLILDNLDNLLQNGESVIIRVPVIPGVNDTINYIEDLRSFIEKRKKYRILQIDLLPYHKTGSSKYRHFGFLDRMDGVEQTPVAFMDQFRELLSTTGIRVKTGG